MQYNIPKEITSEMKFSKNIYLFDLATICGAMTIAWLLSPLVYSSFRNIFYVFILIASIFMVNKSRVNPKKRNYQSIYYALIRNRNTYSRD
ncbi:DUF5592 family protein [Clostridium tarantellae]|uniref:PrgI family protein n=1 Tax=Clostridium tarantellae TaxID=39493 RepID=A0A6I1MP21_9CLOT|nr:DUF5592 family protein [Clostridium tarantellae]MPQ45256.1 hypothetical protein [Clostridium tarantellae]